jgi:hypothetical protein
MGVVEVMRTGVRALAPWLRSLGEVAGFALADDTDRSAEPFGGELGGAEDGRVVVEERLRRARFDLGPGSMSTPGVLLAGETPELPRAYGRDRLVVLARDPWWLFAYWEVTPATREAALAVLGDAAAGARDILRLYDAGIGADGDDAHSALDVDLPPGEESRYVYVRRPEMSYWAEVGLRTPAGRFLPLARSNRVTTPRASPSESAMACWVNVSPPATSNETGGGARVDPGDLVSGGEQPSGAG